MISVEDALDRVLALAPRMGTETIALAEAAGRVLAEPVIARRDQPPFAASAMDGYAMRAADLRTGARLQIIGTSAAGEAFSGTLGPGQAVRIYTGAPVPDGADHVIIQENVTRDADAITIDDPGSGSNIRPAGGDFRAGARIEPGRRLTAADLMLIAAMNVPRVVVRRRPVVALLATGDELVQPGETPRPDQIIASNSFGLRAILQAQGAEVRTLPIARDSEAALRAAFELARGADLLVSSGGASVGDRDLVAPVARSLGLDLSFYKVAIRPGKPLMAGRMGEDMSGMMMVGLPGNPVSSMVCAHVFLRPTIDAMLGLPAGALPRERAVLTHDLPENGPREHYMRGRLSIRDGALSVTVDERQDSSLMSVLATSDCLAVHPPRSPAIGAGDLVDIIRL